MKAISVRAPWWSAILHHGKDIENRDWYTNFRGTAYLHASRWFEEQEIRDDWEWSVLPMWKSAKSPSGSVDTSAVPQLDLAAIRAGAGCLVGKIDVMGCVMHSTSPWFCGKYGIVLANAVTFEKPIFVRGMPGFFDVPDVIENFGLAADEASRKLAPLRYLAGDLFQASEDLKPEGQV